MTLNQALARIEVQRLANNKLRAELKALKEGVAVKRANTLRNERIVRNRKLNREEQQLCLV